MCKSKATLSLPMLLWKMRKTSVVFYIIKHLLAIASYVSFTWSPTGKFGNLKTPLSEYFMFLNCQIRYILYLGSRMSNASKREKKSVEKCGKLSKWRVCVRVCLFIAFLGLASHQQMLFNYSLLLFKYFETLFNFFVFIFLGKSHFEMLWLMWLFKSGLVTGKLLTY